jgi:hypothetical protein
MDLLRDFRELLPIANLWDLQELKSELGRLIVSEHKLIDPYTYKDGEYIYPFIMCSVLIYCSLG